MLVLWLWLQIKKQKHISQLIMDLLHWEIPILLSTMVISDTSPCNTIIKEETALSTMGKNSFFWYQNIYSNRHFKKTIGNKTHIYHVWVYGQIECIILAQTLELDCSNDACS